MTPRMLTAVLLMLATLAAAFPARAETDAPAPPANTGASGLRAEVAGGMGLGTRSFVRPTDDGLQRLGVAPFPAADLGLRLEGWPGARFSLEALVRYRTSIGLSVEERPAFALPNEVDVRAQHVELALAPAWRLGANVDAISLALPVGFALRTFWAEVHEHPTPSYALAGPYLRVELVVPLGRYVTVRVGPEAHGLFFVGRALRNGGVESLGIAVGAEAALRIALAEPLALEVGYRESHAFAGNTGDGQGFEDVERFATARLVGAL